MNATWVAKVGGSLLEPPDFPELATRVTEILDRRGGPRPILVVGGGPTVDVVRRWDRLYELGEEFCHWTAVRLMTVNSRVFERILDRGVFASTDEACRTAWDEARVPLLDCHRFLVEIDGGRRDPLPRRWHVTSDSIAARVAEHFGADELALLKSVTIPPRLTLCEAAQRGHVDPHFVSAARRLERVVSIDLRASPAAVSEMIPSTPEGRES